MAQIQIRRSKSDFPIERHRDAPIFLLHEEHEHETPDGERFHVIPAEIAIKHLVANLDNPQGYDAINCFLGSSGCSVNEYLLRLGERDPAKLFSMTQEGHILISATEGPKLRLRYDTVVVHTRDHVRDSKEAEHPSGVKGGEHSRKHLEAAAAFLKDIGLEPNHERIMAEFCKNCNK
jgi:hypothetical protein